MKRLLLALAFLLLWPTTNEAAQVISRLLGQIQSLQAQVDLLLNSKDGK